MSKKVRYKIEFIGTNSGIPTNSNLDIYLANRHVTLYSLPS